MAKPAEKGSDGSDTPNSSGPSTPEDRKKGEGDDYFAPRPKNGVVKTIVFSPRIQFHETWPSGEYDRRGEAATCNRLTPVLAQQIKEELNTFKMVGFFP